MYGSDARTLSSSFLAVALLKLGLGEGVAVLRALTALASSGASDGLRLEWDRELDGTLTGTGVLRN